MNLSKQMNQCLREADQALQDENEKAFKAAIQEYCRLGAEHSLEIGKTNNFDLIGMEILFGLSPLLIEKAASGLAGAIKEDLKENGFQTMSKVATTLVKIEKENIALN